MEHTAEDGKTYQVQFYSVDIILTLFLAVVSKTETTAFSFSLAELKIFFKCLETAAS
jgi:hypothetical protein